MNGSAIRFQDFEIDARARLTETATFGQAEVDAIRRDVFAAGHRAGAASAAEAIAAAEAGQTVALRDAFDQIEDLRQAADRFLNESADRLEQVVRAALSQSLPVAAAAQVLHRLPETLVQVATAIPDLVVEATASSATEDALHADPRPLPETVRFVTDQSLPFGAVRLRWRGGGADFSADAAQKAIIEALELALLAVRSPTDLDPGDNAAADQSEIAPEVTQPE